jgi:N-acetylated-alpha-linked acidic dipeptidase
MVILGCHFDAWTFGAGDPHAGSIVLFEIARAFAEAAKEGRRPDRTILFANWGAEEFGIIGSVEWAEKHRERLAKNAVAYVNLDMAAMGPRFSASASPLLKEVIEEATRAVPDPAGEGESVHELWLARHGGDPRFGDLGGGSDHLGFYAHLAVPAAGFGAWGSRGVSYHTNYETLTWYRQVVGDDYGPAQMLARLGAVVTARLANAPVLPYDVARVAEDTRRHLAELLGEENEGPLGSPAKEALVALRRAIDDYEESALAAERALALALEEGSLDAAEQAAVDRDLIALERAWLAPEGLPGRPWYRHTFASTDPSSGYAPMMLPLLALALQDASASLPPEEALAHYAEVFEEMTRVVERVHARLVGTQAAADGEKRR